MQNNFAPSLNEFRSYSQFVEVTQIKAYNSQSIETSLNITFRNSAFVLNIPAHVSSRTGRLESQVGEKTYRSCGQLLL